MAGKQIPFFATKRDLSEVCKKIVGGMGVKFVECGLFSAPEMIEISDPLQLAESTGYMVVDSRVALSPRTVEQRRGGVKFAFDPGSCGRHMSLRTGGQPGESILLPGDVAIMDGAPDEAKDYFSILDAEMRERFQKIKSYRVGPDAALLLDQGGRLALTLKSPLEYDLKR